MDEAAFAAGLLRELRAIPARGLTHDEQLTRATLAWRLANDLEAPRFFYFTNAVTEIIVGDQANKDAAWYYPEPKDAAAQIRNYVAFWRGVKIED